MAASSGTTLAQDAASVSRKSTRPGVGIFRRSERTAPHGTASVEIDFVVIIRRNDWLDRAEERLGHCSTALAIAVLLGLAAIGSSTWLGSGSVRQVSQSVAQTRPPVSSAPADADPVILTTGPRRPETKPATHDLRSCAPLRCAGRQNPVLPDCRSARSQSGSACRASIRACRRST